AGRDAARVRVLDDRHGRVGVVVRGPPRGVGVDVVVVAHRLAVQLLGLRQPGATRAVQRRALVRVLPVAQHVRPLPGGTDPRGEAALVVGGDDVAEPGRDGDVVVGRVPERRGSQPSALLEGEAAGADRCDDVPVGGGLDDDGDARVVLRRGPDHGRATDVDLLDALVLARAGRHGVGEGVEVDDDEVEGRDPELVELRAVRLLPAVGEDAGVHPRVQRVRAAAEGRGEPGDGREGRAGDPRGGDRAGGGAGRDEVYHGLVHGAGEVLEARLVVDGDEGTADGKRVSHEITPGCGGRDPGTQACGAL